jgi:hypothetical protein
MDDELGQMLAERAGQASPDDDVGALLAKRASGGTIDVPQEQKPEPPSRADSFKQGLMDVPTGLGQIAEHVAETPLNVLRAGIRGALHTAGATEAEQLFGDVSTKEFDKNVVAREDQYQASRGDKLGFDWWRLAGNAANPINYLTPAGGPAATVAGRVAQAAGQGAFVGAMQPSMEERFWGDKVKGAAIGGATGAATAGLIEAVHPAISWGATWMSKHLKGTDASSAAGAETVINEALKAKGIDAAQVPPNVLSGMQQEVKEAMEAGVAPSKASMANRALAESLPVPVPLLRGQATRDPQTFTRNMDLRGIKVGDNDIGLPIRNQLVAQNRALIDNLNALGAKDAPDVVSAGAQLAEHVRTVDGQLTDKIKQAYGVVTNSKGQSAGMDGKAFAESLNAKLGEYMRVLPGEVRGVVEDLAEGKLPLTVERAQALDQVWSGMQSGKPLSTAEDRAIQIAKEHLLDAPISEPIGAEAISAYRTAKGLAKARFDLIRENPAYKAVINRQKLAEPDQFFKRFVMGGTAREVGALRELTSAADPNAGELMGRTLMGEVKRLSINGGEEEGAFSQAKFSKFVSDPIWQARLQAALPKAVVENLHKLGAVAELVQRPPVGSSVNTSNTGSALINALGSAAKSGLMETITQKAGRFIPGAAQASENIATSLKSSRLEAEVAGALKPGVTLKSLPRLTADQIARNRALAVLATPAAVGAVASKD